MPESVAGRDAAVLVSGGLDSSVLCDELGSDFARVFPIYVRFGLRWEETELTRLRAFLAAVAATRPGLMPLTVLDEPIAEIYGDHWSIAGGPGVPGLEAHDRAVYLPGRNVLLAAKASVWCRLRDVEALAFGTLKGNPFPDSSPQFFRAMEALLNRGMDGRLRILQPYNHLSKAEVLRRGSHLPLHLTVSCLDPVAGRHCGACNKCDERRRAFREAGRADHPDHAPVPADTY